MFTYSSIMCVLDILHWPYERSKITNHERKNLIKTRVMGDARFESEKLEVGPRRVVEERMGR